MRIAAVASSPSCLIVVRMAVVLFVLSCTGATQPDAPPLPPAMNAPAIALSATSLAFAVSAGQTDVPARTVEVVNGGGGTLAGLALSAPVYDSAGAGWLAAALSTTSAPATISIRVSTAALRAGTFRATVPVTASSVNAAARSIDVVLTIADRPQIALSPSSVQLAAVQSGSESEPAIVAVTNGGMGDLTGLRVNVISYGAGGSGWLDARLDRTTAPAQLRLVATPGSLTEGVFTATVPVLSDSASNSPVNVPVTFMVSTRPLIVVLPSEVDFVVSRGAANPGPRTVAVTNGGTGTLAALSISAIRYQGGNAGWLVASLSGTVAPASLSITATTAALPVGEFIAEVDVVAPDAMNSPRTVRVTVRVSEPPAIDLQPSVVAFTLARGNAMPSTQSVSVVNTGGGSLQGLTLGPVVYGAGGAGWLTAAIASGTAPTTISLNATAGQLAAGTYSATVPVSATGASNSPRSLAVTLVITESPLIAVTPAQLSIAGNVGVSSPAPRTVAITNVGGGTLSGLSIGTVTYSSGGSGWLLTSLNTTTAPATLTITPSTSGLAAGTFTATVPIRSAAATNSPQAVAVTLTMTSGPVLSVEPDSVTVNAFAGDSAQRSVFYGNLGTGSLGTIGVGAVQYEGASSGWLTTRLNLIRESVELTARAASLQPGTYVARVPVSASLAPNSPQFVRVVLNVTQRPTMRLSTMSFTVRANSGGNDPAPQLIEVRNEGAGTLSDVFTDSLLIISPDGRAFANSSRLDISTVSVPGGGADVRLLLPTRRAQGFTAGTNSTPIEPGVYTGRFAIRSLSATNPSIRVNFTYEVFPPPRPAITFTDVVAGGEFSCGRQVGGSVWCWGQRQNGELGDVGTAFNGDPNVYFPVAFPQALPSPLGRGPLSVSSLGSTFGGTCALEAGTQSSWCWGNNTTQVFGASIGNGRGVIFPPQQTPNPASGPFVVQALSRAGGNNSPSRCGITSDGAAWCGGAGGSGQLGGGTFPNFQGTLSRVLTDSLFADIAVGAFHSCAVTPGGTGLCWGAGDAGQRGEGPGAVNFQSTPRVVLMPAGTAFGRLALGRQFSCALSIVGTAFCWGANDLGQVGVGLTTATFNAPQPVATPGAAGAFTRIAAGDNHACALAANGDVWCWGNNAFGQLGDNSRTVRRAPVLVTRPTGAAFVTISAGESHTCAVDVTQQAWCWGRGGQGRLGNGRDFADRLLPTMVAQDDVAQY